MSGRVREAMFDERLHPHDRKGLWARTFHLSDVPGRAAALAGGPYAGPPGTETVGGVTYFAERWHADEVASGLPGSTVVRLNTPNGRVGGWAIRTPNGYHDATKTRPFVRGDTWADPYGDVTPMGHPTTPIWKQSAQRERAVERHLRVVRDDEGPTAPPSVTDAERRRRAAIARGYTASSGRLVAAALQDYLDIQEGLFGRGGKKVASGVASAYDELQHPRGRGGEWIEKAGGKVTPHAGHAAPIGPEKPDFSPHHALLQQIAKLHTQVGGDKALSDKFESGDIEPRDLSKMLAKLQAIMDEAKDKRATDKAARDRYDFAGLAIQKLKTVRIRTFGKDAGGPKMIEKTVDGRRVRVSSDLGSEAWAHRQRAVQRNIFDPTGVHSYQSG